MFKTIIPDLVSIDTDLKSLNGFVMCQNFNFFPGTNRRHRFHYTFKLDNTISTPKDYDFRSEYYVKKENFWYYGRNVFGWHPTFKYDEENKILSFNRDYLMLPFSLGGIFTLGEHVSNLIDLDLFLNGYIIMRGIAFNNGSKNICLSAPGFNGKTTLLKNALKNGAGYIAEDYLIMDLNKFKVYPSCPLARENFWRRRKIDREMSLLIKSKKIIKVPVPIHEIYMFENCQNQKYIPASRTVLDCIFLDSLYFLNNLFIKSLVYDKHLTSSVLLKIHEAEKILKNTKFVQTRNYNFNSIINQ